MEHCVVKQVCREAVPASFLLSASPFLSDVSPILRGWSEERDRIISIFVRTISSWWTSCHYSMHLYNSDVPSIVPGWTWSELTSVTGNRLPPR